jgi:hypothetical protein
VIFHTQGSSWATQSHFGEAAPGERKTWMHLARSKKDSFKLGYVGH